MALVLVFVPDPAKGVSEMVRVVVPGGAVVTYMWDMLGGGFPLDPIYSEMQNGHRANASTMDGCVSNGSVTRLVDRRRP
jgi:ubiquinone/menaquinone biosynthesis C-methylase UbiE